jgi:hypothetical protein
MMSHNPAAEGASMGLESRDYYRDWWRKKTGYEEKARFRVPASQEGRGTDDHWDAEGEYLRQGPPDPPGANLHWSIKLTVVLFLFVAFLALRQVFK